MKTSTESVGGQLHKNIHMNIYDNIIWLYIESMDNLKNSETHDLKAKHTVINE